MKTIRANCKNCLRPIRPGKASGVRLHIGVCADCFARYTTNEEILAARDEIVSENVRAREIAAKYGIEL